ncbi:MAG: hypothetical protein ABW073_03580, partial [Acidimicrobiia bacterium]
MNVSSVRRPIGRRRLRAMLGGASAAILMTFGVGVAVVQSAAPAAAATVSFSQCNGHEATAEGAATASTCSVTIVNTIDATGDASAVVYVRACALGACTGDITSSDDVINAVHQCNNSNNAGGSATVCSVDIINNISASAPAAATALTLNQCVGSGGGDPAALMTGCIESTQGSATVTQCNGSGNGGGATMVCNATGTTSAAFPVTVDQCNGSENGGGSTVTCTVSITTNVIDTDLNTPGGEAPGGETPGGGTPGGGTPGGTPGATPGSGTPFSIPTFPGFDTDLT